MKTGHLKAYDLFFGACCASKCLRIADPTNLRITIPAKLTSISLADSRQQESPTRESYSPPDYSQKQSSRGGLGANFWLGFEGGVFGILGGIIALAAGSFSPYVGGDTELCWFGAGAIISSISGIVGRVFDKKPKVGGTLMIVAAIGILISISLFGVLSCILFLVGGILIFTRSRR
jgi:hypothetical protein